MACVEAERQMGCRPLCTMPTCCPPRRCPRAFSSWIALRSAQPGPSGLQWWPVTALTTPHGREQEFERQTHKHPSIICNIQILPLTLSSQLPAINTKTLPNPAKPG